MNIGFLISSEFSIFQPGNGIAAQARYQADALIALGHSVSLLNPWEWEDARNLDVLHYFASCLVYPFVSDVLGERRRTLVAYSPIIDSNQSFLAYRLAANVGALFPRVSTIPSIRKYQANKSDVTICRSRHERQRVNRSLGVPLSKLEVVLNGCPRPRLSPSNPDFAVIHNWLPADFILHISVFTQERKNILRLAKAAHELRIPLVIAGHSSPGTILEQLQEMKSRNPEIYILGFVDEETKAHLYQRCRVFCLPSVHEGTGLVAVEAASYGANIVITKHGGPVDYFGDLAEYVDPFDIADIRRAIKRAWDTPKSADRARRLADTLSWETSARTLEAVYLKHLSVLRDS